MTPVIAPMHANKIADVDFKRCHVIILKITRIYNAYETLKFKSKKSGDLYYDLQTL